ncbi:MAG: DUF3857 and transglutaminase domain-containing protein, partial [Massilibacteroides sp.]|nr:DUF3857 and transglutaminase domain-containing protein [Massilibacteroides sp.]
MHKILLFTFSLYYAALTFAQSPQGDYTFLKDSTSVEVTESGSGSFTLYKKIQINTTKGVLANRVLTYNYDPLTASAQFAYATIYKKGGDIINLDVTQTLDYPQPARMIYWNARQIMIEVGRLQPGDILEYQINKKGFTYALLSQTQLKALDTDQDRFIPPMQGEFYDIVPFWVNQPTCKKVYRLSVPKTKTIQFKFYNGECTSAMRYENGNKIYTFSKKAISPLKREPNMASLSDVAPKLILSTTKSFYEKSKWFYGVNKDYKSFDPTPAEKKKVAELIKGKTTEMEKITVLTHWVADHIRYCGLSMGKGEGFTLHNQQMNFTDRCGVCKDIASTLVGCLRIAGIEAYPAMTMANERIEAIPADQFNHCVTVARLKNGTLVPLDPTWVPFCRELWHSNEQQQNYLPGLPEGSDLCITPLSPPENHYFKVHASEQIHKDGSLTGFFTVEAEGQSDAALRRTFINKKKTSWKAEMKKMLLKVSPEAQLTSVNWNKNPRDYMKAPIHLKFKYYIPHYALQEKEGLLIMKPFTMNNFYTNVMRYLSIDTQIKERKYNFNDFCSRLVQLKEQITLPKGYTLVNKPRAEKSQSKAANYTGSLTQEGRTVTLNQEITLMKRKYTAQDWKGFST